LNRRRFLKYAGASAVVVGASALGLEYLLAHTMLTRPQSSTTAGIHAGPAITNLQWTPTRVTNGKVYDGTMSFDVTTETSPLASARLQFDPVYPPQIPRTAIPAEQSRSYVFSANGTRANISQPITDLLGGKAYNANVKAKDVYGSQSEINFGLPYIREFEAIQTDLTVMAGYNSYWENPCLLGHFCHWTDTQPDYAHGTTAHGTPMLGLYDSRDPFVISKHIDWASGHGVTLFLMNYNPSDGLGDWRLEPFLANPLLNNFKFCLIYDTVSRLEKNSANLNADVANTVNLNDPTTYSLFESDVLHIANTYFSHPSYVRVNDSPVLVIYATADIKDINPIAKLRSRLNQSGFRPYLVGYELGWGDPVDEDRLRVFDATTNYLPKGPDKTIDLARTEFSKWKNGTQTAGIELLPAIYPGYDDRIITYRLHPSVKERSTSFMQWQVEIGTEFADRSKLLLINTWNGWDEDTYIEPSVEDGFTYLQTIRDTLRVKS
jgi:hypothetical protein